MHQEQKKKFQRIRRVVGITSMALALAIAVIPVTSFATAVDAVAPDSRISVEVRDNRLNAPEGSARSTASVIGAQSGATMTISDASAGSKIYVLMEERVENAAYDTKAFYDSDTKSAFQLKLTSGDSGETVSYQSMTLMLSLPEAYRREGYVEVLGVNRDQGLGVLYFEESDGSADHISFYISAADYPSGEFALVYHMAPVTRVQDDRTDTIKASKTTAAISRELLTDRVFTVTPLKQSASAIAPLIANGGYTYETMSVFRTSLTDTHGTPLRKDGSESDYGTIAVQMAIPDACDPKQGDVRFFAVDADGKLTETKDAGTAVTDGTYYATFRADSTGEYAFVYTKKATAGGAIKVTDRRRDCKSAGKTTASVEKNYSENLYLHIEPSEGSVIKGLIDQNGSYSYAAVSMFTLTMTDAETAGNPVTDFGACTITMVAPDGMNPENGTITLLGVNADGTLNARVGAQQKTENGETYLTFETSLMNEYAFIYEAKQYDVAVRSGGKGETGGEKTVSATVTDQSKEYVLIADLLTEPEGLEGEEDPYLYNQLKDSGNLTEENRLLFYEFSMQDKSGNTTDTFGTCTVTIALPEDIEAKDGEFSVYTVKKDAGGALSTEKLNSQAAQSALSFTTTHFTPVAVVYAANAPGSDTAAADTEASASENTNTTDAGSTASDSADTAAQNASQAADADTAQQTAAQNTADSSGSAASADTASAGTADTARPSAAGTADMPKTADATTYRNVLVMILLVFGALMLVSSIKPEKTVLRRKRS